MWFIFFHLRIQFQIIFEMEFETESFSSEELSQSQSQSIYSPQIEDSESSQSSFSNKSQVRMNEI